jgi:hypothetical protein
MLGGWDSVMLEESQMSKVYAGVGSRETPQEALRLILRLSDSLVREGWVCRTGGAPGADSAFADGTRDYDPDSLEVYLPWDGFNGWGRHDSCVVRTSPQVEAYAIAAQHHPGWKRMGKGARTLHARNAHQILGFDVTAPEMVDLIICWTKGGKGGGGTGQAIRMANHYKIPVYDLGNPATFKLFEDLV